MSADHTAVYDALCFVQTPATVNQLAALLAAGGLHTARGTGFHAPELRKLLDALAAAGLVACGDQGRWQPSAAPGWARFRKLVTDDKLREFWWRAWKADRRFDQTYSLELRDEASVVGALRVVIHAGRTQAAFDRLRHIAYAEAARGSTALQWALLHPFDAELMARLEPMLQHSITALLLGSLGGDADPAEALLLQWLLDKAMAAAVGKVLQVRPSCCTMRNPLRLAPPEPPGQAQAATSIRPSTEP